MEVLEEFELDALIEEIRSSETLDQCLARLNDEVTIGNPLKGFWSPVEAARQMPVRKVSLREYKESKQ